VEQLRLKGAINMTHQTPRAFVTQIFIVPKKDGGYYLVVNLKANKIHEEKARVVLVTSVWKTQPWYPLLLHLLVDMLHLLPQREDLVISLTQKEFIVPSGVPQLVAWPLSGNNAS